MARNPDLARLTAAFARVPKEVKSKVKPAIQKGADEIVARAKYLAPVADDDGGKLRDSIRTETGPVELSVTVTAGGEATTVDGYDNALGQEYGSAQGGQQRFFWPAVNTLKKRVRGRINRAIGKAVKGAFSK